MSSLGLKWDTILAKHWARNHVVIVAGRSVNEKQALKGAASRAIEPYEDVNKVPLAVDFAQSLAADHSVVLVLPTPPDKDSMMRLWHSGVTLIVDDLSMANVLTGSGAHRAKKLIAMRDNYRDNIALVRCALSASQLNSMLECKCMLEPLQVKRKLRVEEYFDRDTLSRVRVFNEAESIARRMVSNFPPDEHVAMETDQSVHVMLIGLGSVGQSILLQLARIGHYRSGKRPKLTIVDRSVKHLWQQARTAHPALETLLQVETEEKQIEDVSVEDLTRWSNDSIPISVVYVCTKDEIANLRISGLYLKTIHDKVAKEVGHSKRHLPKVIALDPSGGSVLSDFKSSNDNNSRQEYFHLFSLIRSDEEGTASQTVEGLLTDVDDARAKSFHEEYCCKEVEARGKDPARKLKPFDMEWDILSEEGRDANRYVADHVDVKLRAIGFAIQSNPTKASILSGEEVEILAAMEHDRWTADRKLAGWTLGVPRDDARKIHDNMIPYNQLAEEIKQYDRDSVQTMVEILTREGKSLLRIPTAL